MHLDAGIACAVIGAASSWFVPRLVAWVPEPEQDPEPEEADTEPAPAGQAPAEEHVLDRHAPEKLPYTELAAAPGLAWKSALAGGLAAFLVGLQVGFAWPLLFLLPLVPIGVALAYIDFRTWLLPTRIIAPSYAVLVALVVVVALVTRDWDDLLRAALAWAVIGFVFLVLWFLTPLGYGDVRLAGLLAIALGYLGWGEAITGIYAGFLLGPLAWLPMRALGIAKTKHYPFGPFMLVGAVVGVLLGAELWDWLGYGQA